MSFNASPFGSLVVPVGLALILYSLVALIMTRGPTATPWSLSDSGRWEQVAPPPGAPPGTVCAMYHTRMGACQGYAGIHCWLEE